jgi:3-carboxy-cis,cis-muconate cycloisomerase
MICVFEHPWLGALFGDEAISALWSAPTQLDHYRAFETALAHALEAVGDIPDGHGRKAAEIINTHPIDMVRLSQATARDGLPVPELVRQWRDAADGLETAIHHGATSQDVMDTALALTLADLTDILLSRIEALDQALTDLHAIHGTARLMGHTRMQPALPITGAHRIGAWQAPLARHRQALGALRTRIARLQLGGPVGTRADFGESAPAIMRHMAHTLGLEESGAWHTDRLALADFAACLAHITGSLGKIGQDIALMAQNGSEEIVLSAGGGSSAMAHKSNPVLAELLVTLARYNATQQPALTHALIHEQERSGAAWALEWMVLPPMTAATGRAVTASLDLVTSIERIGRPG